MEFSSSSICINRHLLLCSTELFNDTEFLYKFSLRILDVKDFLRWVFEAIFEAVVKLAKLDERKQDDLKLVQCLCFNSFRSFKKICNWAGADGDGESTSGATCRD